MNKLDTQTGFFFLHSTHKRDHRLHFHYIPPLYVWGFIFLTRSPVALTTANEFALISELIAVSILGFVVLWYYHGLMSMTLH